jgi:acetate CoA/acetoacetate CoA-transferase beta subunit
VLGEELAAGFDSSWVTELAVIAFPDGRATLVETAPSVSVDDVVANTEAELVVPETVPEMSL